jgi:cystathionine beta-synthase
MAKGYIDSSFNVIIADLLKDLGKDMNPIISIDDHATIGDAVKMMELKNVSQLPVVSDGVIKGVLSENALLKPLFNGEFQLSDSVSLAYSNKYKVVDQNDLLTNVAESLLKKDVVLITNQGKLINILSNIDILNFISKRENI